MRIILLPIKTAILVAMLFCEVDIILILAGVLLGFVLLPKVGTMIGLILYSGYMASSAGIIYIVDEDHREEAKGQGFRELSLFKSATLSGNYDERKGSN